MVGADGVRVGCELYGANGSSCLELYVRMVRELDVSCTMESGRLWMGTGD
jgi:hypothetical protein